MWVTNLEFQDSNLEAEDKNKLRSTWPSAGFVVIWAIMDFEDNQLPGMTVLDSIGIKNDDNYEDSNQENIMATQGYG